MAIVFNGVDQYAYSDEAFSENWGDGDQTLAFFVRPQTLGATGYPVAVNDTVSDFSFFTARMEATSDIAGRHKTSASILTAYTTLTNDAWTPAVVTFTQSTGTVTIYPGTTSGVSASGAHSAFDWIRATFGAALGAGSTPSDFFKGKIARSMYFERKWSAAEISAFINATTPADIDAIDTTARVFRYDLISDLNADGAGVGLTAVNAPTFDADDPLSAAATPTISNIDTDNAVNQGQQDAVIALTDFTEAITSVTLNAVNCPIVSQVVGTSVTVDLPLTLATGSYDLVVSGATETATLNAVSYTQTHPYNAPYGLVDANSMFSGQTLTENSYWRIVTPFSHLTIDHVAGQAETPPYSNDINDHTTPEGGYTGPDSATLEILYDDGATAQWVVNVSISSGGVIIPVVSAAKKKTRRRLNAYLMARGWRSGVPVRSDDE